ncbi:MAG: hypothetical protein O7J95_19120, partial [Planctomycetota bacterium]|nr:hypothetical protein [Planctomycetota bacterium]
ADLPPDVMHPDVSHDATRIIFAGFSPAEGAWRIYEIGADGSGLRQITRSDRQIDLSRYGEAADRFRDYDDVDPSYLPDGRIVFVSTRYPGIAPDERRRTTNLYVVNADGSDVHRITSERFGADTPTVEPATGRIVYSRWWRSGQTSADRPAGDPGEAPEPVPPGSPGYGNAVNPGLSRSDALRSVPADRFPGVNSWFLAGIDPDGTDLAMFSGFRLDRERTQAYRPSFLPSGRVLALFIPETPFLGAPGRDGLRRFDKGPGLPTGLGGPDRFGGSIRRFAPPFYASAEPLSESLFLVSLALTASRTDYDIFLQSADTGELTRVYRTPGRNDLDAVVLAPRPVPPVIEETTDVRLSDQAPRTAEEAYREGGRFTFLVENIFFNAPVDLDIANAPPVGRKLAIEFFMNPQRTSPSIADPPIRLHRVDVPADGRVEVELPGGVPLFEVLRLADGDLPVGRDGQIFHVGGMNFGVAGETARCVGCHAGHSLLAVEQDEAAWSNIAPGADIVASSARGRGRAADLLDRSTSPSARVWAAREASATVELTWSSAVRARQLAVHAPRETEQRIGAIRFTTFLEGEVQQTEVVRQTVRPAGTTAPLDENLPFDVLTIAIGRADVTGTFGGQEGPALSEIVVIGQGAGEPRGRFLRGDADCSGDVNLADPVQTLNSLFLGAGPLCCEAAADADASRRVNVSDVVFSLNFLFRGGRTLPAPFPSCRAGTQDGLSCDQEICPRSTANGRPLDPNRPRQ